MSLKHNKKRNVGLVREFFTKFIAESTLNNNISDIDKAKLVWKKYFSKGTELNKEFNAFKTLLETKLSSKEMALEYMKKVKTFVKTINVEKLDVEKTALIREVYSVLNKDFFEKSVDDYTTFASIQICLDHWESKNLNENILNPAIVELEDKILNNLTKQVVFEINKETIKEEIAVDKLALKIMLEKYNKKYMNSLSETQQKLIKLYAFDSNINELHKTVLNIKNNTLAVLTKELNENKKMPQTQKQKFETIKSILQDSTIEKADLNEDTIVFFMSVSKLYDEFNED